MYNVIVAIWQYAKIIRIGKFLDVVFAKMSIGRGRKQGK
jgi:hypothetical protein